MTGRIMQSDYMHWAKFKKPVRYPLTTSEVPHFRMDRFDLGLDDLDMDGASHPRYAPLRERTAGSVFARIEMSSQIDQFSR